MRSFPYFLGQLLQATIWEEIRPTGPILRIIKQYGWIVEKAIVVGSKYSEEDYFIILVVVDGPVVIYHIHDFERVIKRPPQSDCPKE